jgi:flagellar protein FliS
VYGINEYKNVGLNSASNRELVVLLFEAAERHQRSAIEALDEGRLIDGREKLRLTREIFGELLAALDHEVAPEMSANLARLYLWIISRLARGGFENKSTAIHESLRVTTTMRETWVEAFRSAT